MTYLLMRTDLALVEHFGSSVCLLHPLKRRMMAIIHDCRLHFYSILEYRQYTPPNFSSLRVASLPLNNRPLVYHATTLNKPQKPGGQSELS